MNAKALTAPLTATLVLSAAFLSADTLLRWTETEGGHTNACLSPAP